MNKICGIYSISTPNGNRYIGSSINIKRRWCEHRSCLKENKHRSIRLQNAYAKHKDNLKYEILEICDKSDLNVLEQHYIDILNSNLNMSKVVGKNMNDPDVYKKFMNTINSAEYKEFIRLSGRYDNQHNSIAIECSNGKTFKSMSEAARAFGVVVPHIKYLVDYNCRGKLGLRFKKADEEWKPEESTSERNLRTRVKNGTRVYKEDKVNEQTKAKAARG